MALPKAMCLCLMALSLSLLEADCAKASKPIFVHKRYDKYLKMVTNLIWRNDFHDSNSEENILMSPIASVRDTTVLLSLMNKTSRHRLQKHLGLYKGAAADLRRVADGITRLTSGEVNFSTELYVDQGRLNSTGDETITAAYSDRTVNLTTTYDEAAREPSYAFHTRTSWRIESIQSDYIMWIDPTYFFQPKSTSPIGIRSFVQAGVFDYAEFEHPMVSNCTLKSFRLNYTEELSMSFVMLLDHNNSECSSEQDLWNSMQDIDFRDLDYTSKRMVISIPVFKTMVNVDIKKRLEAATWKQRMTVKTTELRDAVVKSSVLFSFHPEIPDGMPIPMIAHDTPRFSIDRSFYFAITHGTSQTPLVAGLINNPLDL